MNQEQKYLMKRIWKAHLESLAFYLCRVFSVRKRKIVFCCIEGTTGYTCNPKYIAEEFIRRELENPDKLSDSFELVWLANDVTGEFPERIRVVRNTLWNRAYELSTAHFWIDNSRKQLEVRKRRGQVYIQTWHAKLGFKPTCLDRGESFSRIAYLVSQHDSDMIDYVLSNSKWYDKTLATGMMYNGPVLRTGSPRCDILVKAGKDAIYKREIKQQLLKQYGICRQPENVHFLMYAPTFRGGSQNTEREIAIGENFPDFQKVIDSLEKRFGGEWIILLRLHPQLVVRKLKREKSKSESALQKKLIDVSQVADMYGILAGCDAFMTDYSSAAFDAAVMNIPVFLYCDDYREYEQERGKLLWDLKKLPFPLAQNDRELGNKIAGFDETKYLVELQKLFETVQMLEDGRASERVVEMICRI